MHADFELDPSGKAQPVNTHGGYRPGAGRKPNPVKSPEAVDLEKSKARKEAALADLHELDYKVKSGEYVSRAAVRQASATAMAVLVQSMRSLSDNLERRGVPTKYCAMVDAAVNETLAQTGKDLAMLGGDDQ